MRCTACTVLRCHVNYNELASHQQQNQGQLIAIIALGVCWWFALFYSYILIITGINVNKGVGWSAEWSQFLEYRLKHCRLETGQLVVVQTDRSPVAVSVSCNAFIIYQGSAA